MRAQYLLGLAMLALPLLQGGCATRATMEAISPTKHVEDRVDDVTGAWRKPDGDILICVTGQFGGSDKQQPGKQFGILFPAGAFSNAGREPPKLEKWIRPLEMPTFRATTPSAVGPCPDFEPDKNAAWSTVPVVTVRETDFGPAYFEGDLRDAPRRYFNDRPATPAVYRFLASSQCTANEKVQIVYVHDKAVFDRERAVHISTGDRLVEGEKNYAYAVLLPVTVAVDVVAVVVALPLFLAMLAISGGSFH